MAAGAVRDVIVDGRIVMRDRKVQTVDETEVLESSDEMSRRIIERAGLAPFMTIPNRFWGVSGL